MVSATERYRLVATFLRAECVFEHGFGSGFSNCGGQIHNWRQMETFSNNREALSEAVDITSGSDDEDGDGEEGPFVTGLEIDGQFEPMPAVVFSVLVLRLGLLRQKKDSRGEEGETGN